MTNDHQQPSYYRIDFAHGTETETRVEAPSDRAARDEERERADWDQMNTGDRFE